MNVNQHNHNEEKQMEQGKKPARSQTFNAPQIKRFISHRPYSFLAVLDSLGGNNPMARLYVRLFVALKLGFFKVLHGSRPDFVGSYLPTICKEVFFFLFFFKFSVLKCLRFVSIVFIYMRPYERKQKSKCYFYPSFYPISTKLYD